MELPDTHVEPWIKKLELLAGAFEGASIAPDQFITDGQIIQFPFKDKGVRVAVHMMFSDYSGSDIIITGVNILPNEEVGKGFGDIVIEYILRWAKENGAKDVRAAQVKPHYVGFWTKNGFKRDTNPLMTKDFVFSISLD